MNNIQNRLDCDFADRAEVTPASEHVRRLVSDCRESCRRITAATEPKPIRSVAIVGAGIMGTAIAIEHAKRSIPVILTDTSYEALKRAEAAAAGQVAAAERAGWRAPGALPITYTMDATDLKGCELVIESIAEKQSAKQALYATLRRHISPDAILATNTSTIPIARLTAGQPDAGRFCGLHFCHPVCQRPLVEVIPGPATSAESLSTLIAHANRIAKLPLIVEDGPGFIVNRLLLAYLNEALAVFLSGVAIDKIDSAMVGFGMPVGPITLLDEIGLDTALQSGIVLADVLGERARGSELLVRLVKNGLLGQKVEAGFYEYPEKTPNRSAGEIARSLGRNDGFEIAQSTIVRRLMLPMIDEAGRLIAEKTATSTAQIDLAVIFGLGFPLWRGGLAMWAYSEGLATVDGNETVSLP
jgi:3-hydroxyacyl-CoA dehydrogenase